MSREVLNRPSSARLKELDRQLVEVNPHHYLWYVAVEISLPSQPALLNPREGAQRILWKWLNEKTLVVVHSPLETDNEHFPPVPGRVRMTGRTVSYYERLDPIGKTPQTLVTRTIQLDLGGNLGSIARNETLLVTHQLGQLDHMRRSFEKSHAIDRHFRECSTAAFKKKSEYNAEELRIIEVSPTQPARPSLPARSPLSCARAGGHLTLLCLRERPQEEEAEKLSHASRVRDRARERGQRRLGRL